MKVGHVIKVLLLLGSGSVIWWVLNDRKLKWEEDVELATGDIVRVQRTASGRPLGEIGHRVGWENTGMTVEFKASANSKNYPERWSAPYVPILLDRSAQGRWVMVATFYSCKSWYQLGRPRLPYVEYHFENGRWIMKPFGTEFIGRTANMTTDISYDGMSNKTIEEIRGKSNDLEVAPEYRRIVSEWKTNC